MILEALGLALLLPVVTIILDPEIINSYPLFIEFLSNYGIIEHYQIIILVMGIFALVYFIKTILLLFISWVLADYSQGLSAVISNKLFTGYINQPYIDSVNTNSAHLQRNVTLEVTQFTGFINNLLYLSSEVAISTSIIITLIYVEPLGAITIMCFLTFLSLSLYYMLKNYIYKLGVSRLNIDTKRIFTLIQSLNAFKEIKLFNKELFFSNLFSHRNIKYYTIAKKVQVIQQIPRLFLELVAVLGLSIFIIYSVLNGKNLNSLIAILSVFLLAAFRLIPSFNRMLSNIQAVKYGSVSIDFIYTELKKIDNNSDNKINQIFNVKLPIIVNNISYKYPDTENVIMNNVNIEIPFGSFVGIIGESGSGKSTFIDNLIGFLKPTSGKITIGDIDVHDYPSSWMKNLGYVPQTIYLSDASLRNNIAFGVDENNIDDNKILKSIKEAELLDFVESLDNGIHTNIGESGGKISGGQRQRIGIARALYNDPKILIFDEGTSSLDGATEKSIIKSILKFKNKKTIIMIAHRQSTLTKCQMILEFNNANLTIKEKL